MFRLEECTVNSIASAFDSGELSSAQLVKEYLGRIAKYDQAGPCLRSVIELNPDALFIAEAMDRERKKGRVRSALHGVPILLKDNINTHDLLATSAGSLALADNYAPYDASIVTKLREAGLVILGKANMTEFANFMSYNMPGGYSSRGGQVVNPYNPEGAVSGSSSGSAVAVAANLCALAVGTETNGSILGPSFENSTVGIKPTRGLVSRHGIIPISHSQDIAGPMARTVADAAALLNILVGEDQNDPSTWGLGDQIPANYCDYLDKDGLKGLRVGVNRGYYDDPGNRVQIDDELSGLAEDALRVFEQLGATLVQDTNLPNLRRDLNVMVYEFQKCLNAYLATTLPTVKNRSLKDIIDFCGDHANECLKYGMARMLDSQYQASGRLIDPVYIEDRLDCLRLSQEEGIDRIMDEHNLDLLFCPTYTDIAPVSGYPAICIPTGYRSDGCPFGVTLVGRPFSEPTLIAAAYAFEQSANARKAPVLD